jgi:hypothetical protein
LKIIFVWQSGISFPDSPNYGIAELEDPTIAAQIPEGRQRRRGAVKKASPYRQG